MGLFFFSDVITGQAIDLDPRLFCQGAGLAFRSSVLETDQKVDSCIFS